MEEDQNGDILPSSRTISTVVAHLSMVMVCTVISGRIFGFWSYEYLQCIQNTLAASKYPWYFSKDLGKQVSVWLL